MLRKGIYCLIAAVLLLMGGSTAMASNHPCISGQGYQSTVGNPSVDNPINRPADIKTDIGDGPDSRIPETEKGEDQRNYCLKLIKIIIILNPLIGFVGGL